MFTDDEKDHLANLYSTSNLEAVEGDELATRIVQWFDITKTRLISESRTAALWMHYSQYICIVRDFIRAERTSNWTLHISATRNMLSLFAATGHNHYVKSSRLYLQTISTLEKDHPFLYEQFMLGNHTCLQTENNWNGIGH